MKNFFKKLKSVIKQKKYKKIEAWCVKKFDGLESYHYELDFIEEGLIKDHPDGKRMPHLDVYLPRE